MQDKFAIGPVTIVQLVGLTTKPRIASAQVDAAVRAADPLPPASAAAGLGHELLDNVGEVAITYFDIKAPQMLSLTAAPMHASIAFEAGVDRPVASSGPEQGPPQSSFDNLPNSIDLAGLIASLRAGSTAPSLPTETGNTEIALPVVGPVGSAAGGDVATATAIEAGAPVSDDAIEFGLVFDGAEAFGDDKILDFETYYADSGLANGDLKFAPSAAEAALLIEYQEFFAPDLGAYDIILASGASSIEPTIFGHNEFIAPQHQVSANDALPPI